MIGVTDIQFANQVRPALTTVAVPTQEAAELAVQMIMDMIRDAGGSDGRTMRVAAVPRLVVRSSTGRAETRSKR